MGKKEKALKNFLEEDYQQESNKKTKKNKNVTVERIDKVMVTEDGRQLLREVY